MVGALSPVDHKELYQGWTQGWNPLWDTADVEIKDPFVENPEFKGCPFTAWSRSVYSHACYACCQEFLPCQFLPFRSIHLHISKTSPEFFLRWLWLTPALLWACRIK